MNTLLIEGSDMGTAILLIVFLMIGVPIILFIVGLAIMSKKKKAGKVILIIATVYSIISLGVCGSMFI